MVPPWSKGHDPRQTSDNLCPQGWTAYFGLGRNASYAAAERGEIPTIRIGRLLRVPVRALEKMLDRAGEKTA